MGGHTRQSWLRSGSAVRWHRLILTGISLWLTGCSINPPLQLSGLAAGDNPPVLLDAPFYPQTQYQCGPAALAGLLGAAGIDTTPEELSPQIYLPERKGSLQLELLAATRRAGRIPYIIEDQPEQLFAQLNAGRPVLVLQNLRTRHFPVWHYAVLVGYEPDSNHVVLNSGEDHHLKMKAPKFMRTWDWAGRWAMAALRPGELPALPLVQPYAEAVANFEAVAGPEAALPAWQAALQHWPHDPHAHLALGNQAYGAGNLTGAVEWYVQGLAVELNNPALLNNLASVLGELGCPRAGESVLDAAAAATREQPHWREMIEQTRLELAALPGADQAGCADLPTAATPASQVSTTYR